MTRTLLKLKQSRGDSSPLSRGRRRHFNTLPESNKLFTEKDGVCFPPRGNSFRINWPMCREKRNIGNGGSERRRNSLADYPIIRFSGTFAIYVSEFYPSLGGGRPFRLRTRLPSHRRAVGIFIPISHKSFSRAFLSRRIP